MSTETKLARALYRLGSEAKAWDAMAGIPTLPAHLRTEFRARAENLEEFARSLRAETEPVEVTHG